MSKTDKPEKAFPQYINSESLSFGLDDELLEYIGGQTEKGKDCGALLDDARLKQAGLGGMHLMRIRRAWRRYKAGHNQATDRSARQWAKRCAASEDQIRFLEMAFASTVATTLKRGRIRIHLKHPDRAEEEQLGHLAEHTESCEDIPPHRWFAAARGVTQDLLWVEVLCPQDEAKRNLGDLANPNLTEDLIRSIVKPVLDGIAKRSERQVIKAAADSLYALFRKAPISDPVAGLATDGKQVFVYVVGGPHDEEQFQFSIQDLEGIKSWLKKRELSHASVTRLGRAGAISPILHALGQAGLTAEPAREAGLMKQAKQIGNSIKFAAALVAARRYRDPLEGYVGIEPDQLGLGEYLDRVDPILLNEALKDARDTAAWERHHGKSAVPTARGVSSSDMIKGVDDLRPGMELTGTVSNITHFGAFIELGLAVQGLVHLSELADKFVQHPSEVLKLGDRVRVSVIDLDRKRKRISLSMRFQQQKRPKSTGDKRAKAIDALSQLFKK